MGRKHDFVEKQSLNDKNYEAPTCDELKMILRQPYSFPWNKEDELIVLEKLFEFSGQNKNANYYTPQFYNYVNKMLSVQLSENQLSYMIYCLRKQYLDNNKSCEDEKDLDSHTLKVLELSSKIWEVGNNIEWPKTKVLRDHYDAYLQVYVYEELGFKVDCLTASVIEEIKKDWQDFRFVEDEFRRMRNRFSLQLCELKANMHNTQLQVGHTFRRKKLPHFNLS